MGVAGEVTGGERCCVNSAIRSVAWTPDDRRGRQTTVVITMGTRGHPLDVSLRPVLGSPGVVSIIFRRDRELLCQAIVPLIALIDALGCCEAEVPTGDREPVGHV